MLYERGTSEDQDDVAQELDEDFNLSSLLPDVINISASNDPDKHVTRKGKKYPFSMEQEYVSSCDEIDYYLPDEETQKQFNTQPNFLIMSVIDLDDADEHVSRKVVFGDANQIYMGLEDLYVISRHYTTSRFECPPGAFCILPWFESYQNSIVHKFEVDEAEIDYVNSTVVPGQPLTQYAMHDDGDHFYTVNQIYAPERSSNVYVMDDDLKLVGKLENIAPGEDFRSSRFMGDKLYLVTFEQTDPLFTIDLSNPQKPEILWELKIPGFSTYLHPYDKDHLIGIGYDTTLNEWGGVVQNGLKVDLYDISDFENPTQKFTETFGGRGSHSEVTYNPRMFVWNATENLLMFPAQLMEQDADSYRYTSGWQGALVVSVHKERGVKNEAMITHIDMESIGERRQKECAKYSPSTSEPKCYTHVSTGEEICVEQEIEDRAYVPEYCFAEFDDTSYLAQNLWNFHHSFVDRILYIWDSIYTLSDERLQANEIDEEYEEEDRVSWK